MGHPMSHSTHVGFSCPPISITPAAGSVSCPRRCPRRALPFQSVADGVGILPRFAPPLFRPYCMAVGVGSETEEAMAEMGGSGYGRGEQTPLRIEPEFGKVP